MSAIDHALPAPRHGALTPRGVLEAWRGITVRQIWTTFLLGCALNFVVIAINLSARKQFVMGTGFQGFLVALSANEIKAFAVLLAVAVADRVTGGDPDRRGPYALAVSVGALISAVLALMWFQAGVALLVGTPVAFDFDFQSVLYVGLEIVLYGAAAVTVMLDRRKALRARERMHAAELDRIAAERRSIESDLQALQARVEPQFLFRTLTDIGRLYARDAAHGERMLDELIAYLHAAMPRMRDTASTVKQELELARACLAIASVVSNGRLTYEIDAPAEAHPVRLPPMMLLPLLDHALSHGDARGANPRAIRIGVTIAGSRMRLEIEDPNATSGIAESEAIASIRRRLDALYGRDASLEVRMGDAGATSVALEMPAESPATLDDPLPGRAPSGTADGRVSDITLVARAGALRVALTGATGRWFAGLGWKPVGFVLVACLVNALRRTIQHPLEDFVSGVWLVKTLQLTGMGVILAVPVMLALAATYNRAPSRAWVRYPALALAVVASSALGLAVAMAAEAWLSCNVVADACFGENGLVNGFLSLYVRYGSLCAVFAVVFIYLRIAEESALRSQQAEVDRARFVQRMEEARLRMLQAQIEPHFLFNTLANVRRLYQTAPADGAVMLDHLMRYLAVALPQMRAADSTLDREAELTRSYLEIQRLRMGHRLQFDIDIPEALRGSPVPPMMLVTLAENAIKHGLAPLPEGGHVGISATAQGPELQVRVADSGQGFTHTSGGGTGLANIRARLAGMYGAAGRLSLALNTPRGVVATIAVPIASSAVPGPASL